MESTTTPSPDIDSPLTMPGTLLDSEGIHTTRIVREQDESHFETRESLAGFVIVGITNDAGEVLLTSTSDGRFWRLPYGEVEPDADYLAAATDVLDAVQTETGVEAPIERVVGVRRFDAVLEDSPAADMAANTTDPDRDALSGLAGHTVAHDVIIEAQTSRGPPNGTGNDSQLETVDVGSTVDWFDAPPDGAPGGVPGDDLALFID